MLLGVGEFAAWNHEQEPDEGEVNRFRAQTHDECYGDGGESLRGHRFISAIYLSDDQGNRKPNHACHPWVICEMRSQE